MIEKNKKPLSNQDNQDNQAQSDNLNKENLNDNRNNKKAGNQKQNNKTESPEKENNMEATNNRKDKEQEPVDNKNFDVENIEDQELSQDETEQDESVKEKEISEDIRDEKFLELQAKFDDLNDRYLRLFSEFDNFRKRTIKEKLDLTKTASEDIITSLLPIIDDLDRALEAADNEDNKESVKKGLELILNKLKTTLRQKGMEEIKAIGEDFNTDLHEAVSNVKAENKKDKGKIVDVVQKGYLLNGKVLRYAKVVVAN